MSYYLCIDGGGTKTIAVVAFVPSGLSWTGARIAQGLAGPSNLTFGLDLCLSATAEAVSNALASLSVYDEDDDVATKMPGTNGSRLFTRVWAAYAGCARPPDYKLLYGPLLSLLGDTDLRLTGDGELLTAPLERSAFDQCVTLICGTGSLGLRWQKQGSSMVQKARSGGWGSLLGDEASGWSLGREGIKSVLTFASNGQTLLPWHRAILDRYSVQDPSELISAVSKLDMSMSHALADSERKKRIAACTPIVVQAAISGDDEARRVVSRIAKECVELLRPLVMQQGDVSESVLVVAGGLGQVDILWDEVALHMREERWEWGQVVKVPEPAMEGIKAIMNNA